MTHFAHVGFVVLCVFASLSKNVLLWRSQLTVAQLGWVRRFDKLSASAAGLLTLSGLSMVSGLAKPSSYYLQNPYFWAKMALFISASALVVWTKVDFKKAVAASVGLWVPPPRVRLIMTVDLFGLLMMAVLGRWIATGIT
jgi:putative membrane protein